jgi:hypothetical protein
MKPDLSRVTFVAVKEGGWSTKYTVQDARGNEWVAKLSKEAQPETAANRLLWAVGYYTEISHLAPELDIQGKGTFKNVRLEARPKDVKRTGDWLWADNPFIGKPEFQGLKIMMALINNWDMKDDNNEILATKGVTDSERRYIISDLGATFGKTGHLPFLWRITRSRNNPEDYENATFVEDVDDNLVDFRYGGKKREIFDDITVSQAKWMGGWLSRLSRGQIRDAFRAANYSPEEIEILTEAVMDRIDELVSLPAR